MASFQTPQDSIIPTITSAVERCEKTFSRIHSPMERDDFLRHLQTLRLVTEKLWQGVDMFYFHHEEIAANFAFFANYWGMLGNDIVYRDANRLGIVRESFLSAWSSREEPYKGAHTPPRAELSLSRMLDCQFHITDNPVNFLMRHLAMRIVLRAYANAMIKCHGLANPHVSKSDFLQILVAPSDLFRVDLPEEWHDAIELKLAAAIWPYKFGPNHHSFRSLILQEFELMAHLFELVLRQLADPII